MSYKPLVKDQEPPKKEEPKKEETPNYDVQLAEARVRQEEMEKRLKEKEQEWEARQAEYERQVRMASTPTAQPEMTHQQEQARIDLGITEEEVAANPAAYMNKIQDYLNAIYQNNQQTVQRASEVITGLADRTHKAELRALEKEDFYKYAKSDIEAYYDQHPEEKIPGQGKSPQEVYAQVVGNNWKSYYEKQAAEKAKEDKENPPPVPEPRTQQYTETAPRPTAPTGPDIHNEKPTEVILSKEEEEILKGYNMLDPGLRMTPAEWKAIKDGKILPKNSGWNVRED